MNRNIKTVFLIAGIILLAYGFYTLVIPEQKVEIPSNTSAYITIVLGVLAVILSLIKEKE